MNLDIFYHISSFLDSASYLCLRLTCKELYNYLPDKDVLMSDISKNKYFQLIDRINISKIKQYNAEVCEFLRFYSFKKGITSELMQLEIYEFFRRDLRSYFLSLGYRKTRFLIGGQNKIHQNIRDTIFYTSLYYNGVNNGIRIYRYCITHLGYNVSLGDICNILNYGSKKNPYAILRFILDKLNGNERTIISLLHSKLINQHPDLIFFFRKYKREMKDKGIEFFDSSKRRILCYFVENDNLQIVKKLLRKGYHLKKGEIKRLPKRGNVVAENISIKYITSRFSEYYKLNPPSFSIIPSKIYRWTRLS